MKRRLEEVDRPQGEGRGNERQAEPVHRAHETAVELEPELVAPVGEQDDVDGERPEEVADHRSDRALVASHDERDRRADRDQHVGDACDRELDGPLLDPEERRHLRVVHLRPEADEPGAHEPRVVEVEPVGDLVGEDPTEREPECRHPHREPERRPHDERASCLVLGVEVEPEEGARDPEPQHDHAHGRQRDDRLDLAEADRAEVRRVDRQQEDGDEAGDDAPEPVDRRLRAEPLQFTREHRVTTHNAA